MRHLAILVVACTVLTQASAQELKPNIPYAEPAHERQVLDVYSPADAKNLPVVFWIHGGGWQTGDKTGVQLKPEAFMDKGFVFVSTNYRLLPEVDMATIVRDIAKSIRWAHDHIAEHGGDPNRLLVMGHSAGAQLAALICTDDRYLKAEGLTLAIVKGCVPVDGDTYDIPAIIETAETRRRVHGQPPPKFGHREKFGNDPDKHRNFSAVTHVAKEKNIPPFLILHVADHPDNSAQAQRLGNVLKEAGLPATVFAAKETNHTKINADLGHSNDPATKSLWEFLAQVVGPSTQSTAKETPAKFRDVEYNGWILPFIQASPSDFSLLNDLFEFRVTKSDGHLKFASVTLKPTKTQYHDNPNPSSSVGAWPITKFTTYDDLNGDGELDWLIKCLPSKERPNGPNDYKEYIVVDTTLIEIERSRIKPSHRKEFMAVDGRRFVMTADGWIKQ